MKIAVIGATGRLAPVVVKQMCKEGLSLRALVRDVEKARKLLPAEVELVKADLQHVNELLRGLRGMDCVYLNLSTEAPDADFQPERDGVRNVVSACLTQGVSRIYKISGLGAYRRDFAQGKKIFVNEIRAEGHRLIEQSGIPYSFFHPSWFMESLDLMFRKNQKLTGFKPIKYPIHWIAGADYARMAVRAIKSEVNGNKDYVIQGPEAVTMHNALTRYSSTFTPSLSLSEVPIGLVKFLGVFSRKFRILGMMGEYFKDFKEEFIAGPTWNELGKPTLTIETFKDEEAKIDR